MKIILICTPEEFDQAHLKQLEKLCPVIWYDQSKITVDEIKELSDNDDKIIALSPFQFDWVIPDSFYEKLKNVKYLCLVTTGYEFIDIKKCRDLGITVTNVPYYSTNAVSENALFMLMALLRKLPAQIKSNYKYEFTSTVLGDELNDKTIGIIGLGHIGGRLYEICKNLGLKTVYWSRNPKQDQPGYLDLPELTKTSDVIFPALSDNPETKKLLNNNLLSSLKTTANVVDLTGVVDKKFLINQVEMNKLAGFAFESDQEKMTDFKNNIFITAPLAWYTKKSLENNIRIWCETIESCEKNQPINQVISRSKL